MHKFKGLFMVHEMKYISVDKMAIDQLPHLIKDLREFFGDEALGLRDVVVFEPVTESELKSLMRFENE